MNDYYMQYDDKNGAINHIITNALKYYFEYEAHYDSLITSLYSFIHDDIERLQYKTISDVLKIIEMTSCFTSRAIPVIVGLYFDIYRYIKSITLFESSKRVLDIFDEKDNFHFITILIFSARYSILSCDNDVSIAYFIINNYKKISINHRLKLIVEMEDALKEYILNFGYENKIIKLWLQIYETLDKSFK